MHQGVYAQCRHYTAQMLAVAAVLSHNLKAVELSATYCLPTVLNSLVMVSDRLQTLYLDEWRFTHGGVLTTTQSCFLLGLIQLQV